MITAKHVKDVAALVGAVAGIAGGIDKTKSVITKWIGEYRSKKPAEDKGNSEEDELSNKVLPPNK